MLGATFDPNNLPLQQIMPKLFIICGSLLPHQQLPDLAFKL
ncbi:hypothetical protein Hanom_Chr17g01589211 [Helianthus anomalus]